MGIENVDALTGDDAEKNEVLEQDVQDQENAANVEVAPGGATKYTQDSAPISVAHPVDEDPEDHIGAERPDPWAEKAKEATE